MAKQRWLMWWSHYGLKSSVFFFSSIKNIYCNKTYCLVMCRQCYMTNAYGVVDGSEYRPRHIPGAVNDPDSKLIFHGLFWSFDSSLAFVWFQFWHHTLTQNICSICSESASRPNIRTTLTNRAATLTKCPVRFMNTRLTKQNDLQDAAWSENWTPDDVSITCSYIQYPLTYWLPVVILHRLLNVNGSGS